MNEFELNLITSWFLASSAGRITDKVGQTLALRLLGSNYARLALAASELSTGIDADADTIHITATKGFTRAIVITSALVLNDRLRPAADSEVIGVSCKSVATDARSAMRLGDAKGVGTALVTVTCVHTSSSTLGSERFGNGETDFAR